MRRVVAILLTICTFGLCMNAQEDAAPRFTFGAEWSYTATVHSGWHYNFFSPEGYRVDSSDNIFQYHSNAEACLNAGYNIDEKWNISLNIGIAGIADHHKAVPMSLRGTYYFGDDPSKDRWFTYIDLGSGISLKQPPQEIFTGKIGGGYRLSLSRNTKLDFIVSFRTTYTHPAVLYENTVTAHEKINRNDMIISGLSLGIGITI